MNYTDENRGIIQYQDRFNQPLLFQDMTFDKICPTDIDAFTEYHNKFFIIMEVKYHDAPLSYGQETALQRLVDAIQESNRIAVLFICRHQISDRSKPVLLKDTMVTDAYYNKQWWKMKPKSTNAVWHYAMQWAKDREKSYGFI